MIESRGPFEKYAEAFQNDSDEDATTTTNSVCLRSWCPDRQSAGS